MAEYSRLASGTVSSAGGDTLVVCPFMPDYIEISNQTRAIAASGVTRAWWYKNNGQGAAFLTTTGAGPADGTSFISTATGTGFKTLQAGLLLQYGPTVFLGASGGITKAAAAVVTTTAAHGLVSGNVVVFENLYQSTTTGMQQIAAIPFVVTVLSGTTFSIPWNTNQSGYTAIATGGLNTLASFKKVLYPALYNPQAAVISAISLGATTGITTTAPHNCKVGQTVAFRIPTVWGTVELNSLPNVTIPGSPIYGQVTAVGSSTTMTVAIDSSSYTAFNSNQPFASFSGQDFAQVIPVGDQNSGSLLSNFASPTFFNGFSTTAASSINGPAIAGAFVNNTFQGFIIGSGVAGTAADIISWRAYLHDVNFV